MISVDGGMSTNDSVIVLSSNRSKTSVTKKGSRSYNIFKEMIYRVMKELSEMIVKDGEGATKFIEVKVKGKYLPVQSSIGITCVAQLGVSESFAFW